MKFSSKHVAFAALLGSTLPLALLGARGSGVLEGEPGIPTNVTSAFPACGQCHSSFPNSRGVLTTQIQTLRSIPKNVATPVTVSLSGGVQNSTRGGFSLRSDKGSFTKGTNTRTSTSGNGITHLNSLSKSWSFSFRSATTGLHQWTGVGNSVNGDGRSSGDSWSFYGSNTNNPGEPFRIFVNDDQVVAFGSACNGSKGYQPIQGMPTNAAVGKLFTTEVHNIPSSVICLGALGVSNAFWGPIPLPLDFTLAGAPGCSLRVSLDIMNPVLSTGSATAGYGSAKMNWGIPNIPGLKGLKIHFQTLVFDATANAFGMSMSGGLTATIQ